MPKACESSRKQVPGDTLGTLSLYRSSLSGFASPSISMGEESVSNIEVFDASLSDFSLGRAKASAVKATTRFLSTLRVS